MTTFIYRCPITARNVQGFVPDKAIAADDKTFESVTCAACRQLHLVNPRTGVVLGSDRE